MNEKAISHRLVELGQELFNAPKGEVEFCRHVQADTLLNDLDHHPHAFVLACVMDRQVKAERAWLIPYRFSQKIGDFSMGSLKRLSRSDVMDYMSNPVPLHRFAESMSGYFLAAVRLICEKYGGDASQIWKDKPSSAEVVYRFLEFKGVGPKIASMAANILARDFKIPLADYHFIDISADVHVRRVFTRLGLCPPDSTVDQVVYKARSLHPEFPGMMDLPCWEIGRQWCKSRIPICHDCSMQDLCPTGSTQT